MAENNRRIITTTLSTSAKLQQAADRLCITRGDMANLVLAVTLGAFDNIIAKDQLVLGSKQKRVRGKPFDCEVDKVNVDVMRAKRLSDYAKVFQVSSTWLFEYAATDILERFDTLEAPNRHNMAPTLSHLINKVERSPYRPEDFENEPDEL